ncbi:hypothetical protein, partial [Bradyrhizobium sp. 61]
MRSSIRSGRAHPSWGHREFPAQVFHFIDLFFLHSILYGIGPIEEFRATRLLHIGFSKIISDQIGSENRAFAFSVHTRGAYGEYPIAIDHNAFVDRRRALPASSRNT